MESTHVTVEVWKPIPGYEGRYEASDQGRIKSLAHWQKSKAGSRSYYSDRIFSAKPGTAGYRQVMLVNDAGEKRQIYVHVLVAAAFLGPRREQVVRHLDGDCLNNVPLNLAYGTHSDNHYDMVRHGTHHNASVTHCPQGHEYDEANTYRQPATGYRSCRACARERESGRSRRRWAAHVERRKSDRRTA